MNDDLLTDLRWKRVGYINQGRKSDTLVETATQALPGDGVLPLRWKWVAADAFVTRYGCLGKVLWSKTGSYHLLMVNGFHILRVWHDTAHKCLVDVNDALVNSLFSSPTWVVKPIPHATLKKCKPLTMRVEVKSELDMMAIIMEVKRIYGLDC